MPPSEFWGLYPIEVWWFLSAKNPELFKETIATKKQNQISAAEMLAKMKAHDGEL